MRLSSKTLTWGLAAAMPIMAIGFSLPLHAATSVLAERGHIRSCSHPFNLPSWLQVCTSAGGRRYYQVDTGGNGPHGQLTASGPVSLKQAGPENVRVEFSHTPAVSFRSASTPSGMSNQAYEDESVVIDEVQGQDTPVWVMSPRDDQLGRFLIMMCEGAGCSSDILKQN